jgi:hypothetical protein
LDDWDHHVEVLQALRKLDFLCGEFHGMRRFSSGCGAQSPQAVAWQADWVLDGFYLCGSGSVPHRLDYWGYDIVAKQYRRWTFAPYGHFGRGFPDPIGGIGSFEGDSLVMTGENESITPVGLTLLGWSKPTRGVRHVLVYTPGPAGSFTMTQHVPQSSLGYAESLPGYYQFSETLFQRQASSIVEPR